MAMARLRSPGLVPVLRCQHAAVLVTLTRDRAAFGADKVRPARGLAARIFGAGRLACIASVCRAITRPRYWLDHRSFPR
jgi:hypothetical protein